MPSTATVTVRPRARVRASTDAPRSICAISQPPKMSPLALVSAGIATVCSTSVPRAAASLIAVPFGADRRDVCKRRARGPYPRRAAARATVQDTMDYAGIVTTIRRLALEAGAAILEVYGRDDFDVRAKSDASPVTEADELADAIIARGLAAAFPESRW